MFLGDWGDDVIGLKIRELRKNAGLTQTELAKCVNRKKQTVSMWETGERNPSMKSVKKVADFFDVPVEQLFDKEDTKQTNATALSAKDRAGMIATLRAFNRLPESYYATLSDRKIIEDYDRQMSL